MKLSLETKKIQQNLVEYCRTGIAKEIPGLRENRLSEYRRLVLSNIQDQLESAFPITHANLEEEIWDELVSDFFANHSCSTQQIWRLGAEFYSYVSKHNYSVKWDIPYLNDLLLFEWEEIDLYAMEDISNPECKVEGEILSDYLLLNPEHRILSLEYPIHKEHIEDARNHKGNYFVLMYREKETGKVQFLDISIWFAFLLEQIHLNEKTVEELLLLAPSMFGEINLSELRSNTLLFLKDLQNRNFIIGYKN